MLQKINKKIADCLTNYNRQRVIYLQTSNLHKYELIYNWCIGHKGQTLGMSPKNVMQCICHNSHANFN